MTGFELAGVHLGLALAIACQSSGSPLLDEVRQPIDTSEKVGGHAGTRAVQAEAEPTPTADPQPAPAAELVERLFELARDWNLDGAVGRIERALVVRLSEDAGRWSGTSRRWPSRIAYHPQRADRRGSLHLSFTNATSVTLTELTRRFGAPVTQIKDKESRVGLNGPAGVRIVAGLFGGLEPTSPVASIRLEGPGPRPPPPKDLF